MYFALIKSIGFVNFSKFLVFDKSMGKISDRSNRSDRSYIYRKISDYRQMDKYYLLGFQNRN